MNQSDQTQIELNPGFDAHLHLRQPGQLLELVIRHIAQGGIQTAYVMPNTVPPLTTIESALEYKKTLESLEPRVKFLVSIYLSNHLNPNQIKGSKLRGITGIKSYPRGVTTNSDHGIESFESYYPLFEAMQEEGLVLNLHGEVPSSTSNDVCVWNAETKFLPELIKLHQRFPKLKIILEHATTRQAIETVKACGDTVACTITLHHLTLTIDDWAGNGLNFCKPVAKLPDDREALREIIRQRHPRFFLGSDSAPHPITKKLPNQPNLCCSAGIYTTNNLIPTLVSIFESAIPPPLCSSNDDHDSNRKILSPIPLDCLNDFISGFGKKFYGLNNVDDNVDHAGLIKLVRDHNMIIQDKFFDSISGHDIIPFWAGRRIGWKILN